MKLEIIATSTFGLEAVVKREIETWDIRLFSPKMPRLPLWGMSVQWCVPTCG